MPLYGPVATSAWTPSDYGLLAANVQDPLIAASTNITTAGTVNLTRINIRVALTASNICLIITTSGNNTLGSTGTFVGLYNSAGTLLSGSADVATNFTGAAGLVSCALTTPQPLAAGTFVWAAVLTNLGTTQPTFAKANTGGATFNAGLTAATFRMAVNGTGVTALPSPSITPASNTAAGAFLFFAGIS